MIDNRSQFEILTFLERKRPEICTLRQIADGTNLSLNLVESTRKVLNQRGWVYSKLSKIGITDSGILALEPYRVKKATILAAGFGSRMMPATADKPKPLVTINGKRIIDTLLDALVAVDIHDITIIRGYHKKSFDSLLEKYPFLHFIDNDEYNKTNNISSAILAKDVLTEGSYLCEADLFITNPDIICKYQYSSNILGSFSLQTDDWSFKMDDSGHIKEYKKGNTFCWNYYGISYWTAEDCKKLNHDWEEIFKVDKDIFWEQVPLQLKKENYAVEIRPCRKQDIIEIDNYYELAMLDPSYQ
mgnify:CR=1 FL=1